MKAQLTTVLFLLSASVAGAEEFKCDQERSRQEIRRLTDAGTIISIDVFAPNVTAVVSQRAWKRSDPTARQSIGRDIDCATFGADNKMLRSVIFRSNRSHEQLGEYSWNQLASPAQRSGLAP